ncbi:MAG: Gldg family protein [Candidatus Hydrogenedentota bacterium]|nr:MAG: Gldg family protein [Candidatus Hydrogenedentota bacterium]
MTLRVRLSTRYGINTAILIALAIGIAAIIGALSYRHNWRKDFTANKRHTLSEQTRNVLRDLKEQIKVTVFIRKGSPAFMEVKQLFDLYEYESKMFEVDMVDPDLNPSLANEAEIRRYGLPVAFFEGEKGRETITQLDEEQATNALIKITRGEKKTVYFLSGHGEHLLDGVEHDGLSIVKKLLEDKNYEPETLVLMRAEQVPDDCAVLVICGPQKDLTEPELKAIEQYIRNGGRALFLIDPETAPSLKPFLQEYGVMLGDDIVIDRLSRLFGGDYLMPVLTNYSNLHPITRKFSVASFFAVARSVSTSDASGVSTAWLAKTGEGSWAETDIEALKKGKTAFNPGKDTPGPVSLAAASEIDISGDKEKQSGDTKKGAIVVFGDSDFATNARINLSGNSDMFMNAVNWLGREETLIAIPPKETKFSPVVLTTADARMLFVLPVIVLPGIVLIGGVYVFARRNRHP